MGLHLPPAHAPLHPKKATGRRLERLYKNTSLTIHSLLYTKHILEYRDALNAARARYFSSLINCLKSRSKSLFRTVNKLLKPPVAACPKTLEHCQAFLDFFEDKLDVIYNSFHPSAETLSLYSPPLGSKFAHFTLGDSFTIINILTKSNPSCQLDPAPTSLLKACTKAICEQLKILVYSSLSSGVVPLLLEWLQLPPF